MPKIEAKIKTIQNRVSNSVKTDLERTSLKFQRVDPTFLIEESENNGDSIRLIGPRDDEDGTIWGYLNNGTEVRYAVLSPDWISKTIPGTINTVAGSGRVLFIDTSNPLPGIEARLWTEILAEKHGKQLQKDVTSLIKTTNFFG